MTSALRADSADDDLGLIDLIDDDPPAGGPQGGPVWKVLIVDDDEDVHRATALAMRGVEIEGRRLEFLNAYSAAQAQALISAQDDIAVMLLDVVMESDDAGLRLVQQVRQLLGREALRIILRTGQPGYAPELETIRNCDINDYRTKSELTRVRLYTSLTAAVRSYRQIVALHQTRRGLEIVVRAGTGLSKSQGLQRYAEGALVELCALLGCPGEGLVCARTGGRNDEAPRVVAATGRYAGLLHQSLDELNPPRLRRPLERALANRASQLGAQPVLFFGASGGRGMAAWVDAGAAQPELDHLLEVFCASISVGLDNVLLYEQLLNLAYNDPLLKIPNRNRFIELIDAGLREPDGRTMAVLDVDDFAGINQVLGHRFGDALLKALGERLIQRLGSGTVTARLAGDSFGVLGPDAVVNPVALAAALDPPFSVDGEQLRLSASSGLVRLGPGWAGGAEMLKDAHIALRQAKDRHRGSGCYYIEAMGSEALERTRLLRGLREAFEADRLFVVYQPQVSLTDGSCIGAEALLRWRTDEGRFVPPDSFIPLAEQSRLIVPIGEFVLRTACRQLAALNALGHRSFRMSVNVSQVQFRDPLFPQMVAGALLESGVDARQVELEITESLAAEDFGTMMSVLAEVRRSGVTVAIDDFGTGFSSLSVLRQMGADCLKIDRAFVSEVALAADRGDIARMVVDLGRGLGMRVLAEGVETEDQRQALQAMGCHEAQGYLFARPMPADALLPWLQARRLS